MHFCEKCQNMYYLKIDPSSGSDKLIYYCRNCGHEDPTLSADNICVSSTAVRREKQRYATVINEYTTQDPTLPRTTTIRCPNQECASNTGEKPREVLYIRYDDTNMKYLYMCAHCETTWKTDEQK